MKLTDILFPRDRTCLVCSVPTYGGKLCERCRTALERAECSVPVQPDVFMAGVGSAWYHEGVARKLVHRLKYDAIADAAEVLSDGIVRLIRTEEVPREAVVTSVPMSARRRRERGIDHGRVLAEHIAAALALRYEPVLSRTGRQHTQRGLSRAKRLRNLTNAFTAATLHGEHVLLIDDVLTTGATALACARVLCSAGASDVWVLTATRARKGRGWLWNFRHRKGSKQ